MNAAAVDRAGALLREEGLPHAAVRAVGFRSEIAAVRAPAADLSRIAALAPRLKELGFQYVALELGEEPATGAGS